MALFVSFVVKEVKGVLILISRIPVNAASRGHLNPQKK